MPTTAQEFTAMNMSNVTTFGGSLAEKNDDSYLNCLSIYDEIVRVSPAKR